jgi:hypothetical protein
MSQAGKGLPIILTVPSVAAVAKALEVSSAPPHRWRNQYGWMKTEDAASNSGQAAPHDCSTPLPAGLQWSPVHDAHLRTECWADALIGSSCFLPKDDGPVVQANGPAVRRAPYHHPVATWTGSPAALPCPRPRHCHLRLLSGSQTDWAASRAINMGQIPDYAPPLDFIQPLRRGDVPNGSDEGGLSLGYEDVVTKGLWGGA